MYTSGSSQTFPLKSQWMDVKTMNKKVTKRWPFYRGVQGTTTRKAKEEKKSKDFHFLAQAARPTIEPFSESPLPPPSFTMRLSKWLSIKGYDTGVGFLESWHSDSPDFYLLPSSPPPPIYKREIIVVIKLSWELNELLCVRLLLQILPSGKGWL